MGTKKACIDTNMYLELFHRVLKYAYLKGTVNKRKDSTINMLLKYARDKLFDRLIKMEKGKNTSRLQTITKRHKSSLELPTSLVSPSSEQSVWNVKSATTVDNYTVKLEQDKCQYNCFMRCSSCSVCIHQYSCTCMDSLLQVTICKHVHLVIRFKNNTDQRNTTVALVMRMAEDPLQQSIFVPHLQSLQPADTHKKQMLFKIPDRKLY